MIIQACPEMFAELMQLDRVGPLPSERLASEHLRIASLFDADAPLATPLNDRTLRADQIQNSTKNK
ncbi:hypothetical protein ACJ3XI_11530 [Litorimonas sp. RW-G-Af-16]|uniref:hypothetical protein n=1 Tax=Litorimonas sp. RW-G-Af-16 TaxID=3241168 RepID=UPI00390C66DD